MNRLTSFADFEQFLSQFTNYERLHHFSYDKKTLGLTRIASLVAELGDPHESYPIVHVAGTKGKGSTSLILESLLIAAGYRVGTYTSPHVEHLCERIRVDGRAIQPVELIDMVNNLLPNLDRRRRETPETFPSFFELMTVLALEHFRKSQVDWAILEVGLGGRLDATNIVRPRWTVITSIGLEHTAQLGTSLTAIAREKAGIVKPFTPLILGPVDREAETEIRRIATSKSAPVLPVTPETVDRLADGKLYLKDLQIEIAAGSIAGPALRTNLALAIEVHQSILKADARAPDADQVRRAIERLQLPARIEFFPGQPPVIVDSAHTRESLRALELALEERGLPRPRTLVFSLSRGKRVEPLMEATRRLGEEMIFTRADSLRSIPPAELRAAFGRGEAIEDPEQALEAAFAHGRTTIITGSFYLSGRLRAAVIEHSNSSGRSTPGHNESEATVSHA